MTKKKYLSFQTSWVNYVDWVDIVDSTPKEEYTADHQGWHQGWTTHGEGLFYMMISLSVHLFSAFLENSNFHFEEASGPIEEFINLKLFSL